MAAIEVQNERNILNVVFIVYQPIPRVEVHVVTDRAEIAVYAKIGLLRAILSVPCTTR